MEIEKQLHLVNEIDSFADTETLETYEDRIHHYKNRNYTYIPMPDDNAYYNTEEGWVKEIDPEQYVNEDTHLMEGLRLLQDHPFLLLDYLLNSMAHVPKTEVLDSEFPDDKINDQFTFKSESKDEEFVALPMADVKEYFPDVARKRAERFEEEVIEGQNPVEARYGIITLADVNRRPVKDMLYKVLSELTSTLSNKIEEQYPRPNSILQHLRPVTIGRWHKDQMEGLEIHIAEHMNLIEMKQVIQSSNKSFVKECGFSSKSDVDSLNSINKIRNRVMHANRSLIYDRQDIQKILDAVHDSQFIISEID